MEQIKNGKSFFIFLQQKDLSIAGFYIPRSGTKTAAGQSVISHNTPIDGFTIIARLSG